VYCEGKSREMILEGTTADKMRDIYTRPHRNSIYEPATIHDIPYEVLRKSFLLLLKHFDHDLASPSLACRAWRVVALGVMNSCKIIVEGQGRIESFACGLHLRSIVGLERCTIKNLVLDFDLVGKEYIPLIARFAATTISSLLISCCRINSSECYEALEVFFKQCDGIRSLQLEEFDFGEDPAVISQTVKDGFSRFRQLELIECRGDIRMFVENTPITDLKILYYESDREAAEDEEIISALSTNFRTLTSVKIIAKLDSSASLLKVVECCLDIERFSFGDEGDLLILNRSDMLAIASLPRLKSLDIGACNLAVDASSALVRCKGLKEFRIPSLADPTILAAIGMNLVWMNLWNPSKEVVDGIVEHCPNLQYLEIKDVEFDDEVKEGMVGSIKNGLMKLAKFKVNNEFIRLGTDWEGYKDCWG
jgi:hypothetical protein